MLLFQIWQLQFCLGNGGVRFLLMNKACRHADLTCSKCLVDHLLVGSTCIIFIKRGVDGLIPSYMPHVLVIWAILNIKGQKHFCLRGAVYSTLSPAQ